MNKARIEELVNSTADTIGGVGESLDHYDRSAIRAALLACARECYEDAARVADKTGDDRGRSDYEYGYESGCNDSATAVRSRAAELD